MADVKCENAAHCLHYVGEVTTEHGPFLPEGAKDERFAFRCCNCGHYQDTRGVEVAAQEVRA